MNNKTAHSVNDDNLTTIYSAIADPTRRELMDLLAGNELSITALASHFPVSRVAITKHLLVLRDANLVCERKVGREHRYQLNPQPLREAQAWLAHYNRFWDEKLANLQAHVENNS
jgi:DNA-binding transcriptional ArsR family regulator